MKIAAGITIGASLAWLGGAAFAQAPQNPSPMVEHVRDHPRLEKAEPPGDRKPLSTGKLYVPQAIGRDGANDAIPLVIAFHCGDWIPEVSVAGLARPLPCVSIGLGAGSERYARPFREDKALIGKICGEAREALGRPISELILVGWSAGYGSIREILRQQFDQPPVTTVILLDGLHTGYVGGKPGPKESQLEVEPLTPFREFAKQAVEGRRKFVYLHTEIFPGTFASTTETADWLIQQLRLKRQPVLKWGPMKTQILGETVAGELTIQAFAGNSAPDHVDLLHAMPEVLKKVVDPKSSH